MNVSTGTLLESLRAIVGERAWEAQATDEVAGLRPQVVAEPADEEQTAALLAYANERGLTVLTRGGGTQLGMGRPPTGGDILLSMRGLNRVLEHAPHDLTVSVQAGVPLTELQAALADAHQWLALDPSRLGLPLRGRPPDAAPGGHPARGATIGGIIATNASGSRRLRYGGVRDQIIGVRVALADGTLAKGGGKVVKNVAGYDLPKLFTGALGTLGVIVSATFRLYPILPYTRTVTVEAAAPAPLCDLALKTIASTLVPTALDIVGSAGGGERESCVFAVRFESGVEAAVEEQTRRLAEMAGGVGEVRMLTVEAERHFWADGETRSGGEGVAETSISVKASLLPARVAGWLAKLASVTDAQGIRAEYRAHAGHGLIHARLSGDEAALAEAIATLREVAEQRGSLVVTDAPPAFAARVDPWGSVKALGVMRRLKERFDLNGILNPGRFVGGI